MAKPSKSLLTRLRRGGGLLFIGPALALVGFVVYITVTRSIGQSFTTVEGGTSAYAWIAANPVYLRIIGRTIFVGAAVTGLCLLAGYPLAYLIATSGRRVASILGLLVIIPLWTSLLVRIFAWLIIFQPNGIVDSMTRLVGVNQTLLGTRWAVTIALGQLLLPFMLLPLINSMRSVDQSLVRAAISLGANPLVAFWKVFVPLAMPGVYAGSLIVFVMSLGFFLAPQLLGSPSDSLIAQTIYQQAASLLNFGRAGALSAILLVLMGLLLVAFLVGRRSQKARIGVKA